MVATGHLEIKIAVVPKGGIYHDKVGFFEDEEGNIYVSADKKGIYKISFIDFRN